MPALVLILAVPALPSAALAEGSVAEIDSACTGIDVAAKIGSWSRVSDDAEGDWRLSGSIGGSKLDNTWVARTWFENDVLVEEIKRAGDLTYRALTGAGASIWASSSECREIAGSFEVSGSWAERKMAGGGLEVHLEYTRYEPPSGCKGAGARCDPATDCCPGNAACPSTRRCPQ